MKETDYNLLHETIKQVFSREEWTITDIIDIDDVISFIIFVYLLNDIRQANGCDFKEEKLSIIISKKRVSVIWQKRGTYYQNPEPMILYEDLYTDIMTLAVCIQAAFDRINP